jgi:DeoR/GlpR family transcriptional regulator of sugar metabolism
VEDGETIILDVGSTTIELARALRGKRGLTVVTASLPIADELSEQPDTRVVLTGGIVRPGERSMIGALAEAAFNELNCDTVFLGVAGVDLVKGLTEFSLEDARVKQAAIRSARQVVVLADEAKLGSIAFAHVAPLAMTDVLVSDAAPHHAVVRGLSEAGVRYVQAAKQGGVR